MKVRCNLKCFMFLFATAISWFKINIVRRLLYGINFPKFSISFLYKCALLGHPMDKLAKVFCFVNIKLVVQDFVGCLRLFILRWGLVFLVILMSVFIKAWAEH